ncbi:MAG: glycosyltransferase [Acidobacteria bacterium]|nr:glycosyltransferase [Acidobacteriota bacterium]
MKPIRIGYVVKRFPRLSETFIANEILELERLGAEVTVLALRSPDEVVEHGWLKSIRAEVVTWDRPSLSLAWEQLKDRSKRTPARREEIREAVVRAFDHPLRSGRRYLAEAVKIAQVTRDRGLQHLHAHFANHPAFVAMLTHLITGIPYSFTAHAKDIYATGPTPALWRQQVQDAAFAVTVSEANRAYLADILGPGLIDKLHCLYNGVDLKRIQRGSFRLDGRLRMLFVGRLIEKKGADILIDAVAQLHHRGLDCSCTLIGSGELEDALRDRARRLALGGIVHFESKLPHEEIIRRMQAADLFVLPCRVAANGDRDALPTVLLEAMATGLPCVSTPINGVPEIIEHGRTGVIVPENDPQALAAAIGSLFKDPLLRRQMGAAARSRAEERFDLRRNVAVLKSWLEHVAASPTVPKSDAEPQRALG